MNKRKVLLGAVAGSVVLAAGVGGLAAWTGAQVETQARAAIERLNQAGRVRISDFSYQRSWLGAQGQFKVQMGALCGPATPDGDGLLVKLQVSHLPGFSGPARVDAVVHLPVSAQPVVQMASGDDVLATVVAHAGWTGTLSADIDSAPLTLVAGSEASLKAERSHGRVSGGAQSLQVDWQLPGVQVLTALGNATLTGVAWHVSAASMDRDGGQSQGEISLTHAAIGPATLDDLKFSGTSHRHDGQVDADTTYRLGALEAGASKVSAAEVSYAVQGIDAAALDTVNKLMSDSCGLTHLDAAATRVLQGALKRTIARGLQQVLKVGGQFDEGKVEAALTIRLQAPPGNLGAEPRLAELISLHGDFSATRDLAQRAGLPDLVKTGYATQAGDRLSTTFDYAAGKAKVNGRTTEQLPGGDPGQMIATALEALQRMMGGDRAAAAPAEAPAEVPAALQPEVAPVTAPLEAAPPASAPAEAAEAGKAAAGVR